MTVLPVDVREDWWVDDWLITDGWVRDVEMRSGLYVAPAKRGENSLVANRTGQLWVPKTFDQGSFTLNVWLGDDTRVQVEDWWDLFLRAVSVGHRLPRYKRSLADGSSRYCDGEVVSQISPTALGNKGIRCAVEVQVPDGVWWDGGDPQTVASVAGGALPQTVVLAPFETVTAPQEHLTTRVDGPISNPQVIDVTDGVDGEWWTYDGVIPAGQALIVGANGWGLGSDGWDLSGVGGFIPDPSKLRYSGATYLIVPPAKIGNVPTVQLRGSSGGAGTQLTVTGIPAWLV